MSIPILKLEEVVKTYDSKTAVDRVSLTMPQGSIFGMLGPNGAGKTSLIRIITTITQADAGQVYLNGESLNSRHPEQIGYMPEERGMYKKMKVGEHLLYLGRLKGLSKAAAEAQISAWFERLDIKDWWNKKIEELSKGMQQKVQFVATVLHRPKLLILDEPFSGLDPINANLLKDEIFKLHQEGTSIIFSTHRMEQVEEICDHIVLINQGQNILEGRVQDIRNAFKKNTFRLNFSGELPEGLAEHVSLVQVGTDALTVRLEQGADSNALLGYLMEKGVHIRAFNEIVPSLNEIFIQQVGLSNAHAL